MSSGSGVNVFLWRRMQLCPADRLQCSYQGKALSHTRCPPMDIPSIPTPERISSLSSATFTRDWTCSFSAQTLNAALLTLPRARKFLSRLSYNFKLATTNFILATNFILVKGKYVTHTDSHGFLYMKISCYLKKYKNTMHSFGIPPAYMWFQTLNCNKFELKLLRVCYSNLKKLYKQTICRQILLVQHLVSVPARGKDSSQHYVLMHLTWFYARIRAAEFAKCIFQLKSAQDIFVYCGLSVKDISIWSTKE